MNDTMIALLQVLLTVGGGAALFLLWRMFAFERVGVGFVAVGFLGRAFVSIALFWVSWMELPFAASLQLGDGLWFYGLDGQGYLDQADALIQEGPAAILLADRSLANYVWVHLLAWSRVLFGSAASVAVLLNLSAYLGGALIVARIGRRLENVRHATIVLVGLSFSPSLALWSTQPLKDTFFVFLVIAFYGATAFWVSRSEQGSLRQLLFPGLILALIVHLVGGIRWYYGVILWTGLLAAMVWHGVTHRTRRRTVLVAAIGTFLLLGVALAGNRPGSLLRESTAMLRLPGWAAQYLGSQKVGFEKSYKASTVIQPGSLIAPERTMETADSVAATSAAESGRLVGSAARGSSQPAGVATEGSSPAAESPAEAAEPPSQVRAIAARAIMVAVPSFITEPLGLASAGEGRGLWLFADLDTTFTTCFAVLVVVTIWRTRDTSRLLVPLVVFLGVTVVAALPMLYVVNNFGTLFRLREMLVLPIMLLPLAVIEGKRRQALSETETEPEPGSAGRAEGVLVMR